LYGIINGLVMPLLKKAIRKTQRVLSAPYCSDNEFRLYPSNIKMVIFMFTHTITKKP